MTKDLVKIDPKEFGLKETEAKSIESAFMPKIVERDGLKKIYEQLLTNEITPQLCDDAKALRLKLVKVRTGIADIHKTQKAFFLAAGRYVDAWKNKETEPVTQMEEKLSEIEEYYKRIELERVLNLQIERSEEIRKWQDEIAFVPGNLGELTEQVWNNYLLGVKTAHEQKLAAEKAVQEAEYARVKAEKEEQERIRKENEQLKIEAEKREKTAEAERKKQAEILAKQKAEADAKLKAEQEVARLAAEKAETERKKLEAELKAKQDAEAKAKAEAEAKEQAELAKGDAEKVRDLINDLIALETKYQFKSKKNQKIYSDVGILLEKIIKYIEQ